MKIEVTVIAVEDGQINYLIKVDGHPIQYRMKESVMEQVMADLASGSDEVQAVLSTVPVGLLALDVWGDLVEAGFADGTYDQEKILIDIMKKIIEAYRQHQ